MSDLAQLRRDTILATHLKELDKKHVALLSSVATVKSLVEINQQHISRIGRLPKGDKGDKGDIGLRGLAGKDGKDGRDGKDGKTLIKGVDYNTKADKEEIVLNTLARIRQPKDGENAVVDEEKIAKRAAELIKEQGMLETKDIKGLSGEISSYRNQLAMKQAGQHGGGDTVVAGTGIIITALPNGTKEISSPGGTGVVQTIVAGTGISVDSTDPANPIVSATGGGMNVEVPTGLVDSSNVTFTFTAAPKIIVTDTGTYVNEALMQNPGMSGFTLTGLVATLALPPNYFCIGYY